MACSIYSSVVFKLSMGDDLTKSVESGILSALSYYKNKSLFSDVYCEFESFADIGLWKESQIRGSGYVLHTLQASLRCLLTTSCYTDCVLKAIHLEKDADTTVAVAAVLHGNRGMEYDRMAIFNYPSQKFSNGLTISVANCRSLITICFS